MAIFLGLVQGVAEFLPISSSGHLAIFQNFFGMDNVEESHLLFDVLLHLGTLVSVCIFYRKDILEIFKGLGQYIKGAKAGEAAATQSSAPQGRLAILIIVATLPLVLILPIKNLVEQLYLNTFFIGFALIITGLLLFVSDKLVTGRKNERNSTVKDALLVGLSQAIAVIPGLSRSGTTITIGVLQGFDRAFAVKFSFLMSIPAILGANIISLFDALKQEVDLSLMPKYLLGVVVAAVSGYFAIRLVKMLVDKGKFGRFAYYCWAVGLLTIILSFIF